MCPTIRSNNPIRVNNVNNSNIQRTQNNTNNNDIKTSVVQQTQINTNDNINVNRQNNISVTSEVKTPKDQNVSNLISQGLKNKQQAQEIRPKGATEYSEVERDKIISEAEKHGKELFPKDPISAADSAWAWSLEQRQKDPKDVNWAAAEHYLYAKFRSKESKVEGVTMGVLAAGYDIVKAGLFAIDKPEWISTNGKKDDVSKPTLGSTFSGIKGAIDGF